MIGKASCYGPGFYGNLTASGWRFNPHLNVVASLVIPQRTVVDVIIPPQRQAWNPQLRHHGITIQSTIADKGPYTPSDPMRLFDLSIGFLRFAGWFDPAIRDDELERKIAFLWGVRWIEVKPIRILAQPRG